MENGEYILSTPPGRVFTLVRSCTGRFEHLFEWRDGKDSGGRRFAQPTENCGICGDAASSHFYVDEATAAENLGRAPRVTLYDGTPEELSRLLMEKKRKLAQAAFDDSLEEIEQTLRQGRRA